MIDETDQHSALFGGVMKRMDPHISTTNQTEQNQTKENT